MSLVLDALRRVEKAGAPPGAVGVRVASYRPPRRAGRSFAPLVLGIAVGGAAVFLFLPAYDHFKTRVAPGADAKAPQSPPRTGLGGAGLPPPLILEFSESSPAAGTSGGIVRSPRSAERARATPAAPPPLVLQAISERDSYPIAVINEQLVKEGDLIGGARVVKIGADSVEVLLANGVKEVVRFAPPPQDPTPSPDGR